MSEMISGSAAATNSTASVREHTDNPTVEKVADVLVVGSGCSGTAAALAAAERGAKVVIMEGSADFGGSVPNSHGGYFVESYLQKRAGETWTCKDAYDAAMYFENYLCDPILMRDAIFESAETLRWCNSHGAGLSLPCTSDGSAQGNTPQTYHVWDGISAFGSFRRELEHFGNVELIPETKCAALLQGESGEIVGAVGEDADGTKVIVKASKVFLGTGGFIGNREMVAEAVGDEVASYLVTDASGLSDGSGVQMAWSVGAGKRGHKLLYSCGVSTGFALAGEELPALEELGCAPMLWVNRDGRRFMNEEIVLNSLLLGNAILAQGGYAYVVFDNAYLNHVAEGNSCFAADFDEAFRVAVNVGGGFKADNLTELAEMLGIDAGTLKKTVSDYNIAVETKLDKEFFKSQESLLYSVKEGPFYAVRFCLLAQGTCGGVAVNRRMQAVDGSGKVIPNLYVGGNDAGGLYAASYTNLEGLDLSWALTSGRLAGINMAEQLGLSTVVKNSLFPEPEEVQQ